MSKSDDELLSEFIAKGAIEVEGIDSETGEFLYRITDKMKDVNKQIYDEHMNNIYVDTMYFWERGFVDIDDFTSSNPKVSLTSKAFDSVAIANLPIEKAELFMRLKKALGFIH